MKTYHFIAIILFFMFVGVSSGHAQQTAEQLYQSGLYKEEIEGKLDAAIEVYETIINKYQGNRSVLAKTYLHIGLCREKLGNAEARKAYEVVVRDYADQGEPTKLARERLNILSGGKAVTTNSSEAAMRRIWVAGKDLPLDVSPDGRYVVFMMNDTGDLWLRDLQSGEQRQITREGSWVDWTFASGDVAISPDGKRIAYGWTIRSYGELRLSALDGSSMRVLQNGQDGRWLGVSNWMPDGQQILTTSYNLKDNTNLRHIISLSDGSIHNIGQPEMEAIDWGYPSPDGRYIVYGMKGDIFVYDTMTKKDSVLIKNPSKDSMVGWMKDGSGILFVSDRSGTRDLYLQEIKNGRPLGDLELLRLNLIASQNPNFTTSNLNLTSDGRLFQLENTGTTNAFISPVNETSGKVTGTQSLVDPNYPNAAFPEWSPDGKLLYYEIFKGPLNEQMLFIRSEETGETREIALKPKLNYWYRPILSPDGKRFVVTGTAENMNFGIFAIDLESGEVSQLARIPGENNPIDPCQNWSPDGKAIFYKVRSFEQSEEFIIRRKDLITGEEKDIFRGIHTRDMKISSDGTRFVYFRNDMPTKSYVLGILDLQSGKEFELWRVPEADSPEIQGPTWAPDGKHILVAKSLKQGTELWRFPIAGGQGEKLHFFPEYSYGFVMHPSGKRIAFTQIRTNYELWVLENFLPK